MLQRLFSFTLGDLTSRMPLVSPQAPARSDNLPSKTAFPYERLDDLSEIEDCSGKGSPDVFADVHRPQDALQATVDGVLSDPALQLRLMAITTLFEKLERCGQPETMAMALDFIYRRIACDLPFSKYELVGFLPRLIETMCLDGLIHSEHAPLAQAAVARLEAYADLNRNRNGESRPRGFTAKLTHAAIDSAGLERMLRDPEQWANLVSIPRLMGDLPAAAAPAVIRSLKAQVDEMETCGFLKPALCDALRARLPDLMTAFLYRQRTLGREIV